MIHFKIMPQGQSGTLQDANFNVPFSRTTEEVLNLHAEVFQSRRGSLDPELDLFNFVADRCPFITLLSRERSNTIIRPRMHVAVPQRSSVSSS